MALTPASLKNLADASIAPYYSTTATYAVGDKVRYLYALYECNTVIDTAEAWTAAHWTQIDTLQEQIDSLQTAVDNVTSIPVITISSTEPTSAKANDVWFKIE